MPSNLIIRERRYPEHARICKNGMERRQGLPFPFLWLHSSLLWSKPLIWTCGSFLKCPLDTNYTITCRLPLLRSSPLVLFERFTPISTVSNWEVEKYTVSSLWCVWIGYYMLCFMWCWYNCCNICLLYVGLCLRRIYFFFLRILMKIFGFLIFLGIYFSNLRAQSEKWEKCHALWFECSYL